METLNIKLQDYDLNTNLENAFMRGSAWNNLYKPYKFETTKIYSKDVKNQILLLIQIYSFISVELSLFLGTHPNNSEALSTIKQINTERYKMIEYYEANYNTLCSTSTTENYNFYKGDMNV